MRQHPGQRDLLEQTDGLQQRHHHHDVADQGQHDMHELPGIAGAVDCCRFDNLAGNALQRGERDDHHERDLPPGERRDDDQLRQHRVGQPFLRMAQDADVDQHKIHDPVVAIEDPAPQDRDGNPRHQPDLENRGAEQADQADAAGQHQSDDKAEQRRQHDRGDDQERTVPQHLPKLRIGQEIDEVRETDEVQAAVERRRVCKAEPDAVDQRIDQQYADQTAGGQEQQRQHKRLSH